MSVHIEVDDESKLTKPDGSPITVTESAAHWTFIFLRTRALAPQATRTHSTTAVLASNALM
jgi:hypothetical protein